MARRRDREGQNLDSLLDTMANVVGILIVLVAVTQLSVGDAVERIRSRGAEREVGAEELEAALTEKEELDAALTSTGARWRRLATESNDQAWLIDDAAVLVAALDALPERDELRGLGASALQSEVDEKREELERSIEEVESHRAEVARLDEFINGLPAENRPKVARLPDPRPPPRGSKRVTFLVRYGRVLAVDVSQHFADLDAMIALALGPNRDRSFIDWEDRPYLVNFFNKQVFWRNGLRWTTREVDEGRTFRAEVVWRDERVGEGRADLPRVGSAFLERLREYSVKKNHIHFWVWSDSYEAYLEARYLAERIGYSVSWLPLELEEELGLDLAGASRPSPSILID